MPWAHLKRYPNRGLNKKALKTDCRNQGGYIEKQSQNSFIKLEFETDFFFKPLLYPDVIFYS